VRAPLNSRVVSSPGSTKAKGKAKEESLDRLPIEIQEALVLEDLLYVLMVKQFFCNVFPYSHATLKGNRRNVYHPPSGLLGRR
jgi:hypothetical protein